MPWLAGDNSLNIIKCEKLINVISQVLDVKKSLFSHGQANIFKASNWWQKYVMKGDNLSRQSTGISKEHSSYVLLNLKNSVEIYGHLMEIWSFSGMFTL